MEKFCSFFCSVEKYGPLILLSVQYMVEPFCLTNFSATSHSTHPVPAVPSQAGRKSEPFLSFFISIWLPSATFEGKKCQPKLEKDTGHKLYSVPDIHKHQ